MEDQELEKKVEKILREKLREMITQTDIPPQTIKERHIDWEEFGVTLGSSIIQKLTDLVFITSTASASATVNNGAQESVTVTVSDNSNDTDRVIHAVMHITAYETSVTAGNEIPWGSNLVYDDYIRFTAHDWGSNDNKSSTLVDMVRNDSGGNESVLWRVNARYIGQESI